MSMMATDETTHAVETHRRRLFGIAYRMLGQVHDAEDLVQETYLRWHQTDQASVEQPAAWLVTVVTRLAIDRLRRSRAERTTYVGTWLPEPLARHDDDPGHALARRDTLSLAFLALLERLGPQERAALLLRDVFDEPYALVATVLRKREPAVRQLVHRARARIRAQHGRAQHQQAPASAHGRRQLLDRFLTALASDDAAALMSLFAEDARFTSDGGGKVAAAINVVHGRDRIVRFLLGIERKWGALAEHRLAEVNGEAGMVTLVGGRVYAVTAFQADDVVRAVYRVMNPDKLKAWQAWGQAET